MIRPISFSANSMNFKGYTVTGGEPDEKPVKTIKEIEYIPVVDSHTRKQDIKNSLCVGALAGAIIAGASVSMYKDHQIKDLLNDMAEEMSQADLDTIKVQDITKDSIPEIVLQEHNGTEVVYDLTSGAIYYKDGSDIVEKIK